MLNKGLCFIIENQKGRDVMFITFYNDSQIVKIRIYLRGMCIVFTNERAGHKYVYSCPALYSLVMARGNKILFSK